MPSISLHPPTSSRSPQTPNPFPSLIQTPSGFALLEIQGTLHTSSPNQDVTLTSSLDHSFENSTLHETDVGRIVFPHYNPSLLGEDDLRWMKQVYLYVGKHQRLTGEVKKLGKPVAVLRKRVLEESTVGVDEIEHDGGFEKTGEELEVVEVIMFKILFAGRPEPVDE
jgi:chromosome transmission fidelity protein 8